MGSLYKLRGFTRDLITVLKPYLDYDGGNYLHYSDVPAKLILKISKKIPKENLEERQNASPSFKDFVEIAKKYPYVRFECYIITDERDDERISIEGIYIPQNDIKVIKEIKKRQLSPVDENRYIGRGVRRLWWD